MHTHLPVGERLVEELKWVHGMVRRDLKAVRALAAEVLAGLDAAKVSQRIKGLQANGPLWQLKVNCLRYCSFVHHHHEAESAMLFPALRHSNPALGKVINKLEADHLRVADLLDEVEGACRNLSSVDDRASRQRVVDGLATLARELLEHLDYEEEQISPTLRTWKSWPRR
jgi:iron-sulfur cluster repair protein YtfE (RIC family)